MQILIFNALETNVSSSRDISGYEETPLRSSINIERCLTSFLLNPDLLRLQESKLYGMRTDPILGKFFNWPKNVAACFSCLSENMSQLTLMITCAGYTSAHGTGWGRS